MASIPSPSTGAAAERSGKPPSLFAEDADPRFVFRSLLARTPYAVLRAIAQLRNHESEATRASTLAAELTDQVDDPLTQALLRKGLTDGDRLALGLFGLTEARSWPLAGLRHALAALAVDADAVLIGLFRRGLLTVEAPVEFEGVDPTTLLVSSAAGEVEAWAHPALIQGGRLRLPIDPPLATAGPVAQVRESDGLEPILRLAALWQRTGAGPLRRTQQGVLYKRDRERIEDDGVLTATIDDAIVELPALATLWMGLARRVGLIHVDRTDESLHAAPAEFWTENAVHLPQMIASAWLGLRSWAEWAEPTPEAPSPGLPLIYLRPAVLLWLATVEPEAWIALDDLAARLDAQAPGWERVAFEDEAAANARRARAAKRGQTFTKEAQATRVLERILLGGAYALGLVKVAEEQESRRRVVQLTPLGRYVMAVGPPPPPRPTFDHFLFVQPNLEIIAYRQGLTPPIIGRLSRFAWWSKIGAAVELRLTQESIALGLEWGFSAAQILEVLAKHSQRALPGSVKDAVDRWADRREQVTFYPSATLIEFIARADRDQALATWTAEGVARRPFVAVGDRFLLVEDAQDIPTGRISTSASRDYRLPPERCVTAEADGVTLTLDPARSDLLVEAELARFADEEPMATSPTRGTAARRRFTISTASLERGVDAGMTLGVLSDWFRRRTGEGPPAAVRLMMRPSALAADAKPWPARKLLVLTAPSAEVLDGVLQHPETRPLLGDRLGPVSVVVPEASLDRLRAALKRFGVEFDQSS
ncbi:helicase-associated domain-containing protein [Paludisphaera mucosa]|uniref:Helicase-associated domain-containing protein n=1 Tax=Paludisphaera mucosa TaxID=3030827 RepID=A0ABT6F921_9BACT|nr:helicase-associated domain-containing protein [Paludisphaera mucosa]MDG3003880.1 helicase-associated domain-containing protein [Paludisphaera mucosa]